MAFLRRAFFQGVHLREVRCSCCATFNLHVASKESWKLASEMGRLLKNCGPLQLNDRVIGRGEPQRGLSPRTWHGQLLQTYFTALPVHIMQNRQIFCRDFVCRCLRLLRAELGEEYAFRFSAFWMGAHRAFIGFTLRPLLRAPRSCDRVHFARVR